MKIYFWLITSEESQVMWCTNAGVRRESGHSIQQNKLNDKVE